MTEDELRAVMAKHGKGKERAMTKGSFWCKCENAEWPKCETYRLAKLALAGMQVVTAARSGHERLYAGDLCLCGVELCDLASALAEYEEATHD